MKVLRYPVKSLLGDYLRAGLGLAVGLGVLASVPTGPVILPLFGSLSLLFGVFGLRTVKRHVTEISLDDTAIHTRGLGAASLPWAELKILKLRYYGSRRQRARGEGEGFMQLSLRGGGSRLSLDSSLEGFDDIAWRAAKAASDNQLSLDTATAGNLLDMGIDDPSQPPAP